MRLLLPIYGSHYLYIRKRVICQASSCLNYPVFSQPTQPTFVWPITLVLLTKLYNQPYVPQIKAWVINYILQSNIGIF